MVRTQIQLTEEQARKVRQLAAEHGVSMAEVIRRCVDKSLTDQTATREELYERAARLIGQFKDRKRASDLSTNHDRYLDETYQ